MATLYPMFNWVGRVHAYLLDDGHELTLVDALGEKNAKTILAQIARIGSSPQKLKHIILTHGHITHVRGAAALQRQSGAKVYVGAPEKDIIEGRAPSGLTTWIPQRPWRVLPQQYLLNLSHVLWKIGLKVLAPPPVKVDHALSADGEKIGPVEVFHTPGHSPGCFSFYWPEGQVLLVGDAVVTWPRVELGWKGLTEDYKQNVASLRRLVAHAEQARWRVRTLATGHGPPLETEDGIALLKRLLP
jgi:glyoxylase-like metal-dependent hydrolase (beta-lactamase superfamily II)